MSRLSDRLNELNSQNLPLREIADRAAARGWKISFTTVRTYMRGEHPDPPSPRALKALAAAFGAPVSELEEAAAYTGREPFNPDPTSDQLTQPQRNAVNEIIRLLATGNQGAVHDRDNVTSLSARPRQGAASETSPQKMRPLPVEYVADRGPSAGEEGWEHAQELGEESQDDET